MRIKRIFQAVAAVLLVLTPAGCDSFLQGEGLTASPNDPVTASTTAQFVAVQANMFRLLEGQLARYAGIFTQQIIGSNNQQQIEGTQYGVAENNLNLQWNGFFTGAGLIGMRNVQRDARAAGDARWEGIIKVWEAYAMGTAASLWGDIPYSEAGDAAILAPRLDPQQQVYARVQSVLDSAIVLLAGAGPGPGQADLIYGGNADRWIRAAYTLKARFHLHTAERLGNAAYQAALDAAIRGINEAPTTRAQAMHGQAPGDFRAFHGTAANVDANIWQQFLSARQGDIAAGHALVQLLKDRNDPRLTEYFDPNPAGVVSGMDQNMVVIGVAPAAVVNTSVRRQANFRQPLVTWVENQLIMAEARHRLGDVPAATTNYNNVRQALGLATASAVTLNDIALEKYIAMYQNIEVWSDWKRNCMPLLRPFGTNTEVLGRLPYGATERTSNPNIPLPSQYPGNTTGSSPVRNWNDPQPCPRP